MKAASYLLLALALSTLGPERALAQDAVTVALFPTLAQDSAQRELAGALDPVWLSELDRMAGVQVSARPPLDLAATQLALDCIGETPACLRTVAEHAVARALLAPSIERAGDETVVTLLYFDSHGEGVLRSVTRRYRGQDVERAALDAVPAMLRELFGGEERAPEIAASESPVAASDFETQEPPPDARALPTVPLVLAGSGVALLGVGVAFGLMSNASEDDFADVDIRSEEDVDAALQELDSARKQALIANLGMGLGAALIVAGAVTFFVASEGQSDASAAATTIMPRLGPGEIGVSLSGRFEEVAR
jgi:hypothetical protein